MIPHSKPYITAQDQQALKKQLASGMLAEGATTDLFEKKVGNYLNTKHCIATSSGVSALELALGALAIQHGDEVIIPSYVCDSVYKTIENYGAVPVLCDIGKQWNMTPETVAAAFSKKTKVILLVNIFGIDAWHPGFKKFGVPLIEDNCQAFGCERNGKMTKLRGEIGILSFHATKCLATGEGGMLVTNNIDLYKKALEKKKKHQPFTRMTDIQAALGISQLAKYDDMKKKRKQIASHYFQKLPNHLLQNMNAVKNNSIYFRFLLTVKNKSVDECISYFAKKNISVRKGVDAVLHQTFNKDKRLFGNTELAFKQTLSIPIYPSLKPGEVNHIIKEINLFFDERK